MNRSLNPLANNATTTVATKIKKTKVNKTKEATTDEPAKKRIKKIIPELPKALIPGDEKKKIKPIPLIVKEERDCLFYARFLDPKILRIVIEVTKEFVNACLVDFTQDGISIITLDADHKGMIECIFGKSLMDENTFFCQHPSALGIDLKRFNKFIKLINQKHNIALEIPKNKDSLDIYSSSKEDNSSSSKFGMTLLNLQEDRFIIPDDMVYSIEVKISTIEFQRIIKELYGIGKEVNIRIRKNEVEFLVVDKIVGFASIICRDIGLLVNEQTYNKDEEYIYGEKDEDELIMDTNVDNKVNIIYNEAILGKDSFEQKFNLRLLNSFSKSASLSKTSDLAKIMKIKIGENIPLCLEYNIAEDSIVRFYSAPMYNDDDENNTLE